ncbi:MAG: YkgJ family cysteine cluster protein [Treponemataceae bacterium]|nr:YkgJ family cysteine cluster protein [Treponemataceae bacterium]
MTKVEEICSETGVLYQKLSSLQQEWYRNTGFCCPDGCGSCCQGFEPDLYPSEAAFMAGWLIDNQPDTAEQLASETYQCAGPGPAADTGHNHTCIFYDNDSAYHCSIYGGRPFICRLFGASSFRGKNGDTLWRPCKFYPAERLASHRPPLVRKDYKKLEVEELLGECPPVMADIMEQAVAITPDDTEPEPLREVLPAVIKKILFERQLSNQTEASEEQI